MTTVDELRYELLQDELDYEDLALRYGVDALPGLQALVVEDDPRIAPKATFLAGLVAGPTSAGIARIASQSRHEVTRVAAASTLPYLRADAELEAASIAAILIRDSDIGVRARAARSAAGLERVELRAQISEMAMADPDQNIRELAASLVR
jgi:hypothetical protein